MIMVIESKRMRWAGHVGRNISEFIIFKVHKNTSCKSYNCIFGLPAYWIPLIWFQSFISYPSSSAKLNTVFPRPIKLLLSLNNTGSSVLCNCPKLRPVLFRIRCSVTVNWNRWEGTVCDIWKKKIPLTPLPPSLTAVRPSRFCHLADTRQLRWHEGFL
jgi:hypothetical protein